MSKDDSITVIVDDNPLLDKKPGIYTGNSKQREKDGQTIYEVNMGEDLGIRWFLRNEIIKGV